MLGRREFFKGLLAAGCLAVARVLPLGSGMPRMVAIPDQLIQAMHKQAMHELMLFGNTCVYFERGKPPLRLSWHGVSEDVYGISPIPHLTPKEPPHADE